MSLHRVNSGHTPVRDKMDCGFGETLLVPDLHAPVTLFYGDNKTIVHLGDDAAWI